MKILVINAGSSSLKYQLINIDDESVIAKGMCERIGIDGKIKDTAFDGREYVEEAEMKNHTEAFKYVEYALVKSEAAVLKSMSEIGAVGHRIVQGGAIFNKPELVNEDVIEKILELSELAPLHNIGSVQGIRACIECLGKDLPQVVVFDNAFHSTMPQHAYMYAIPYEYYEKYAIRRYGFHGTSHKYVSAKCAEVMGRDISELKLITCHLGNGSSISAVEGGKCIDTSMGFTPLDGLIMGTRSGSLDPSVVTFLGEKEGISYKEMSELLNKKSGYLGISGISNDDRDLQQKAAEGNERAKLAIKMLDYQIIKLIGSYAAAMNGVDAIVFTGGIGENVDVHRAAVCKGLTYLGVDFDFEKNAGLRGKVAELSKPGSKVKVYVIPTNEELSIARDTYALVSGK